MNQLGLGFTVAGAACVGALALWPVLIALEVSKEHTVCSGLLVLTSLLGHFATWASTTNSDVIILFSFNGLQGEPPSFACSGNA